MSATTLTTSAKSNSLAKQQSDISSRQSVVRS